MTYILIATNETITLDHSIFDVIVFDKTANRINEYPTNAEVEATKLAKAQYLIDQKVIQETSAKVETKVK